MFMQMMFLLDGVFNFNMINYKSEVFDHEESAFYLPWEDCGNAVKLVLYGAKWGGFLHL